MVSLHELTIEKFRDGLARKQFSALEIVQAIFQRIKEKDPGIGAYLSLREEAAVREAETVDVALAKNETLSPLAGVPLAIKDNMLIEGEIATAASKILEHYTASYDAHVIKKLKDAKAVILGKTNLDEFAMGASTENSAFHVTKNPHDPSRVAGGSSGGSAAAVAAHMAVAALGSDTGGSIRQPAALSGTVGMKPTYGTVSRSGLIAMASSLDQIGPLTKTVKDAAILFDAIRGKDPMDATSMNVEYDEELLKPNFSRIKQLRVGVPAEYFAGGMEKEVEVAVEDALQAIKSLGLDAVPISLPHTKYALACYYIVMPAEVSSNLARFDGIRYARLPGLSAKNLRGLYDKGRGEGFGQEPKRRIILGTFVLSSGYYDAYYKKAQEVRALIKQDFEEAFKKVDVVFAPVSPTRAFKIGEKANDPLSMYLADIFTISLNLAGLPGISIPVRGVEGLPVGFQLIGKPFREADIVGIGEYYEKLYSA